MNKLFVIVLSFLILITNGFAFDISDSNDNLVNYFSLSDSTVKIQTTNNVSNYIVNYVNGNITKSTTYNLSSCNNSSYCSSFLITDFLSNNGLVLANTNLSIILNNVSKDIYLDITKPDFTFISSSVDRTNMKVNLIFSYSDNYLIDKVELYKKIGNSVIYLTNLTGLNNYSLDIINSKDLNLQFKVYDKAGNFEIFDQLIIIPDIINPKIDTTKLTLKNGKYDLTFSISDENLSSYEVVQKNLKLSGTINGTTYKNTINLPFDSGNINFKVYDKAGNLIIKTISLSSPFINTYNGKFFNTKSFKFNSNAINCKFLSLDEKSDIKDFVKINNSFSIDLNVDLVKNYILNFYCENDNFKEFLSYDFFYDVNSPTNSSLDIEKLDNGFLKIKWNFAKDKESDVSYKLYRDSKEIYSGTKLKYIDENVKFPINYSYQIEVIDDAKNSNISSSFFAVPKKTNVGFLSNLLKEQEIKTDKFNLDFITDINTNVTIIVKNNLKEIFRKDYYTLNSTKIEEVLLLKDGVNEVTIIAKDKFGNSKEESFFITYSVPILSKNNNLIDENKSIVKTVVQENKLENNSIVKKISKVNDKISSFNLTFWLWILFWIIVFIVLVYGLFFKREVVILFFKKVSRRNKIKGSKIDFSYNRRHDSLLSKNLINIKRSRINRQNERQNEKIRKKLDKEREEKRTLIEQKKHDDLAKRKTDLISFNVRKKSKRSFRKIIKNENLFKKLKNTKKPEGKSFVKSLIEMFKTKGRGIEKEDSLSKSLSKTIITKSWEKPKDYVAKIKPIIRKSIEKNIEKIKPEKISTRVEKRNNNKISLDDYLNKRKKKKRFLFAQEQVDKDILNFEKK